VSTTLCAGAALLLATSAPAQNLFVGSNYLGTKIIEVTPGGGQSTIASGLFTPFGLAFDRAGNLFAADYMSGYIYEFANNKGTISTTPTLFASGLSSPYGLAFDSAGDLFTSGYRSGLITEITTGGAQSNIASGLSYPTGLAFDTAGNLFVSNLGSGYITRITTGGVQSTFASGLEDPDGLAFDSAGNLFEADLADGYIYRFAPSGAKSTFASGIIAPDGLAFDSAGDLFVASTESFNGNADFSGSILEFISSGGNLSTNPTVFASGLSYPEGLAVQPVPEPSALGLLTVGLIALLPLKKGPVRFLLS